MSLASIPSAPADQELIAQLQYALALWKKLTRFLEYPELELSTNLAENSMRPVALGRKNWLHIGSPQAGPKVAAILSVVETCRRLKVPVRDYFSTILPGLADLPIRCLPALTPTVWAARSFEDSGDRGAGVKVISPPVRFRADITQPLRLFGGCRIDH